MFFLFSLGFMGISVISFIVLMESLDFNSFVIEFCGPLNFFVDIPFIFLVDYVSLMFFSVVCVVSFVVFIYSKFYMGDLSFVENFTNSRFYYLVFFFVLSMFFLVFSGSWVTMMVGWDGLGITSFLLVIFYSNSSSMNSGTITFLTNRLGDCFFILSFMFIFINGWCFLEFFYQMDFFLFYFVMFLGCITKSAQLPFSSWLPAAMAAPTPVSSLVHSSTLVTAGVFLLVRFNLLLFPIGSFISLISVSTMFLAAVCGTVELDFKKVVAMSTLSQLGFMIFSISCGYWVISFIHMCYHAFFKSLLFMSTGSLMHSISGDQDSRHFGSFGSSSFSKIFFISSCISLVGFPFSLGFYSKDAILGVIFFTDFSLCSFIYILGCMFTVSYTLRLLYSAFMGFPSFSCSVSVMEDIFFYFPLLISYLMMTFLGYFFMLWLFPPMIFSLLDFILGLLLIFSGSVIFLLCFFSYTLSYSLSSIIFLSVISSSYISFLWGFMNYSWESSWGESSGAKGLGLFFSKVKDTSNSFFYFFFSPVFLIILLLWFLLW